MSSPREKTISSAANPLFRELLDLLASKGVKKQSRFLLFGEKVVRDALSARGAADALVLVTVEGAGDASLERLLPGEASILRLTKPLFAELDVFGTHASVLVCPVPKVPDWTAEAPAGLEVLLALSDPSNLGASLRSAAAFGASKIVLLRESASPFHPKATRAASGLTLSTPFERGPSIRELPEFLSSKRGTAGNASVFALDMAGSPLAEVSWPRAGARLLLGEEGQGLPADLVTQRIAIPMVPGVESLNAAASLAVALYAWRSSARPRVG